MKLYSGMCIGGPRDGMAFYNENPYFEAPIYKKASILLVDTSIYKDMKHEIYVYRHMIGLRGGFGIDFWANEKEFPTVETILSHVFSEYCARERSR